MLIEDTFTVRAPVERVWEFLLDIQRMSACIPGVESLQQLDDETYLGDLVLRIGPISSRFHGQVTLIELDPPHRLTAMVSAEDKSIGSVVKVRFSSTLESQNPDTLVAYRLELNLRGRMAQFGEAVIRATARKMTGRFTACVRDALET